MPFGQSTPFSTIAAAAAGFAVGEIANFVASELGASELGKRTATFVGHTAGSMAAGYAVNAIGGADITGAAVTTVQSPITAVIHALTQGSDKPLNSYNW